MNVSARSAPRSRFTSPPLSVSQRYERLTAGIYEGSRFHDEHKEARYDFPDASSPPDWPSASRQPLSSSRPRWQAPRPAPRFSPLKTSPLQAHGVRFKPHERVRVRLESPTVTATRRIVVGAGGTFTATFTGVVVDRCLGYSLSAVGSLGDRAAWSMKLPPPGCPPA